MRMLYICTGNSFRSPVAEALTRRYRPEIEVESAGTDSSDHVAEIGKELLEQEDALRYVKPSPEQVSQRAIDDADKVVAMMPEHREYLENNFETGRKIEVWNIIDPLEPRVGAAESFEEIKQNVRSLPDFW